MQSSISLVLFAVISMAVSLFITLFYKKIRAKIWTNKYKLPDKISLFPELENIPDKSSFIQASFLLESAIKAKDSLADESTVEMLMTDEGVLQSGFNLEGEKLILKCESPQNTKYHEFYNLPIIIGKSGECNLRIVDDSMVNGMHGIIFARESQHFYLDMNSISGSVVDKSLASGPVELQNGSRIQICQTLITFFTQSNMPN